MSVNSRIKRLAETVLAPFAPLAWRARSAPRLLVLMYHRVLPPDHPDRACEQPGMYVSPGTLAMHLRLLKRYFEIVHLDDWARRAAGGQPLPRLAAAVTFDDGWRDNYAHAWPILQAQAVPATIYLLADLMGTQYSFWPNRLVRLLRDPRNDRAQSRWPDWLRLEIAAVACGSAASLPLSMQQIDALIARCKSLHTDTEMLGLLGTVDTRAVADAGNRDLMNWDEAREMSDSGLIRFGSHTRRHIRLDSRATPDVLQDEIRESRLAIERQLRTSVTSFCYPNGDHCPAAVDLVRASYATAVTTRRAWNSLSSDPHLLNRVGVHEDVSSTEPAFLARLALAAGA
ncbi:MAG: putative polysaccharide deacetylase [Gammaproteobacteria bacterium]|nr:putative polysaccharide deacetylase [Gammaproteobacteria bacterium]